MSFDFERARRWVIAVGLGSLALIALSTRCTGEPKLRAPAEDEAVSLLSRHQVLSRDTPPEKVRRQAKAAGAEALTRVFLAEAANARAGTLRWLVEVGAEPARATPAERSRVLMDVASRPPHDRLAYLIELGWDPRQIDSFAGETLLHRAAAAGADAATVTLLVKKGLSVQQAQRDGRLPLHVAAAPAVAPLVAAGADVEALDGEGFTPLMRAVMDNRTAAVQALIQAGASVHSTDRRGRTALHLAYSGRRTDVVDLLESAGAARTARDHDGLRPGERNYDLRR